MVRFAGSKKTSFSFFEKRIKKGLDISVFFCYTIKVVGIDLLIFINHLSFYKRCFQAVEYHLILEKEADSSDRAGKPRKNTGCNLLYVFHLRLFRQDLLEKSRSSQKRLDKLLKICFTIRVVRVRL